MRTEIEIMKIWRTKRMTVAFEQFNEWYLNQKEECHYCRITEEHIRLLDEANQINNKRKRTRGKRLEMERKDSIIQEYTIENLALCCYWCNNAKTDTFTELEFKKVGEVFEAIWKERLKLITVEKKNGI